MNSKISFARFAKWAAAATGHPKIFMLAVLIIIL